MRVNLLSYLLVGLLGFFGGQHVHLPKITVTPASAVPTSSDEATDAAWKTLRGETTVADGYVAPLENGCLVDALQAYARLPEGVWKHILAVRYSNGAGHAMLIFNLGGHIWVYDRFGSRCTGVVTRGGTLSMLVDYLVKREHQPVVRAEVLQ